MNHRNRCCLLAWLALVLLLAAPGPVQAAKNVIIMISDGAGYNTFNATSMYQGKLGKQVYDGEDWVQLSCTTYPLSRALYPTGKDKPDPALVYDPRKAWDTTAQESEDDSGPNFAGYSYLTKTATDSAAAATAMVTGVKTYNNAINWTAACVPLHEKTIPEMAKAMGKSVGVITTVEWSHATPAGLGRAIAP
jgi:alkaline phosphatase